MDDNHPSSSPVEMIQEEVPITVEHEMTQDPSAAAQQPNLLHDLPVKVLIIDAIGVLQGMKKTPAMHKILDKQSAFNMRIEWLTASCKECRAVFDRCMEESLKKTT